MPGFYSRPIVLDGVAAIKDSVLSTGWNPVSKIVGFISEDEQITAAAVQELKKTFPNKDSAIKFVFRNSSLLYSYEKKIGSGDHRKLTSMDVRNCLLSITKNVADKEIHTDYPSLFSLGWGAWVFDTSRDAFQFLDSGEIKCWNSLLQKVLRTLSRYWSPAQSKFGQQTLGEEGCIPWTKQEDNWNCFLFFFVIYIASNANCKNLPLAC